MHRARLTAVVVVAGLLVTAVAGVRTHRTRAADLEQRLLVDAVEAAGNLEGELERHVGAASALRDLFDDGPVVTRAQFERAIEAIGLEQFPELHDVNVVRPVAAEDVSDFVREKVVGGYPGYRVADPGPGPGDGTRWLVSLVAPYDHARDLLGIDVRRSPALEATLAAARDTGDPHLGPLVGHTGDAHEQRVGLAVPVYAPGAAPGTVADRREALVGWVIPVLLADALVAEAVVRDDLAVTVVDVTDDEGVPLGRAGVDVGPDVATVTSALPVFGRRWEVRVSPGPRYLGGSRGHGTLVVVVVGLVLTALSAGLVHVLGQRRAHAERLVRSRTRDLATVNDELASSLEELRRRVDVDRLVQAATRQVAQAVDLDDALARLRAVLADVEAFDRVGFSVRLDGDRMRIQSVAGPGRDLVPAGGEYQATDQLQRSFLTQDTIVNRDTTTADPGTVERALADRGIRGLVAIPLVARGQVAGVLSLGSRDPLALTDDTVARLRRVGDAVAGPLTTLLALEAERSAAEQLRHLDQLKDEFLGVVAHDLKGPLSVVTGFTDLLLEECAVGPLEPGFARQALDAMRRAAAHQERLIADLLEAQRLTLGEASPQATPVVLAPIVREAVADLPGGSDRDVTFEDGSGGAVAVADPAWIHRVVTNLVSNAWKYGSPDVELRVVSRAGVVRVEVADHGPGIDPADTPRLFQRFSRLPGGDRARTSGTGLGLYICKQLVEAQGGRIGVDTAPGRGSTFWFELPAVDARIVPV